MGARNRERLAKLPALEAISKKDRPALRRLTSYGSNALNALLLALTVAAAFSDGDTAEGGGSLVGGPEISATESSAPSVGDAEATVLPEAPVLGDYEVVTTDNLWNIAEGDVEGLTQLPALDGVSEFDKQVVLRDMEQLLRSNPKLIESIGLGDRGDGARDPSLIYPGEQVNLDAYNTLLESIKSTRGIR
jgi:hypothetical protein